MRVQYLHVAVVPKMQQVQHCIQSQSHKSSRPLAVETAAATRDLREASLRCLLDVRWRQLCSAQRQLHVQSAPERSGARHVPADSSVAELLAAASSI